MKEFGYFVKEIHFLLDMFLREENILYICIANLLYLML